MQTKQGSIIEVCANTGTGIYTAYLTWQYIIVPWVKIIGCDMNSLTWVGVIALNASFTVVSVIRGYLFRRIFNFIESGGQ